MPLAKRGAAPVAEKPAEAAAVTPATTLPSTVATPKVAPAATKARAAKAGNEAALTKEEYWDRKEARDIRTGECIRLSGVLQALLGSVNYGQYCTTSDRAAYLTQVKNDAKELAKFITDEA